MGFLLFALLDVLLSVYLILQSRYHQCFYLVRQDYLSGGNIVEIDKENLEKAISTALLWLNDCDAGEYNKCWENGSKYFKNTVTQEDLNKALIGVRTPLGKVELREQKSTDYTINLPGAPDGEYVVIKYAASFENKKTSVKTITPMKEKDGTWKISGYFIK